MAPSAPISTGGSLRCSWVELLLGGTLGAVQSTALGGTHYTLSAAQLPPFPSSSASMTVWNARAQSQRDAIESQPYVEMLASQGLVLRRLFFVNVTNTPGIPAGVSTVAAVVIASSQPSAARASSAHAVSPNTTSRAPETVKLAREHHADAP